MNDGLVSVRFVDGVEEDESSPPDALRFLWFWRRRKD